jgi:flagellar FliJ protein
MANPSALETLIDLTTQQSHEAAKRLGQAVWRQQEAQEKFDLLHSYRQEYADRLQQQMQQGLSAEGYGNFNRFLQGLDRALAQQTMQLEQSRRSVESARAVWQHHERKRLSYGTLVQREQLATLRQALRQEQKQTDELAARPRHSPAR